MLWRHPGVSVPAGNCESLIIQSVHLSYPSVMSLRETSLLSHFSARFSHVFISSYDSSIINIAVNLCFKQLHRFTFVTTGCLDIHRTYTGTTGEKTQKQQCQNRVPGTKEAHNYNEDSATNKHNTTEINRESNSDTLGTSVQR